MYKRQVGGLIMSEEKVIEIKALSPEENPAGKEMETADSCLLYTSS